jgi:hypothetical protein
MRVEWIININNRMDTSHVTSLLYCSSSSRWITGVPLTSKGTGHRSSTNHKPRAKPVGQSHGSAAPKSFPAGEPIPPGAATAGTASCSPHLPRRSPRPLPFSYTIFPAIGSHPLSFRRAHLPLDPNPSRLDVLTCHWLPPPLC